MDFEELQKNWLSQPVNLPENTPAINDVLINQWKKQQRRTLWSNIFTTLGFIGALLVFAWVYISFHQGHSAFFGGSLLFMSVLLFVYLWVLWKGIAYKKNDPTLPSKKYLQHALKKLYWRRKTITAYTWIYSVLLWAALMFYGFDVTSGGSILFKTVFISATTIYIFGMMALMKYTKQKKQLKELDQLISDMQQLKDKLED